MYLVLFLLGTVAAIISASETSFRALSFKNIQSLSEEGFSSAKRLSDLLKDPTNVLATMMLGNLFVNISIISIVILSFFRDPSINLGEIFLGIFTTFIVMFIFCVLLPKSYAAAYPQKTALKVATPIYILSIIFHPLVYLVNLTSGSLLKQIGSNFGRLMRQLTEDEIKNMVELGHDSGVLEQYETKIIHSALTIDQVPVSSILTPRVDIECVSVDVTVGETLDLMIAEEYSRMPVYEDNIDNIVGIVHIKDLFRAIKENKSILDKSVRYLSRKVFHVPETKNIIELLKEMQAKRVQMAIVSDEFGGTAGLITMEDILEEIVGEIRDEYDIDETPSISEIDQDTVLVDAMVSVSQINRALGINLPNNQTIGRLIFESLGEVPGLGQSIDIDNVNLKVHEIDGMRVQKILVKKFPVNLESEELTKVNSGEVNR